VYLFLKGPPEWVHSPFPLTWGRKRSWFPKCCVSVLHSSRRAFLNWLHHLQKPTKLKTACTILKLNYLIEGNNQCLFYEYSETYNYSLLQNVEFFLMLQRVVHICATGFSSVNVYIDFSKLHCLVRYTFYAYVSFRRFW